MIEKREVYMGTLMPTWSANKKIKTITFSITDECNLRCTYCYFTHKNNKNVMSFDTARKAIDDILTESLYQEYDGAIWEFIGGEPTIEMDLVDRISDYILFKMYELNHKWLYCYRFMIGSNGLLYDSEPFQKYIKKHHGNIYVAITIDGSKEKHDLSRIKKDGTGSYDDVRRIIPLWQNQFGGISTKATFSHADLPYLKDSIVNLWNMGIKSVSANLVFENVWQPNDVEVYKQQLYELAHYIIDNDLWDDYSVRFFDPNVGVPNTDEQMRINFCGTGNMLAVNTNGDYYPCVRFMPSAIDNHLFEKLGDVDNKIDPDRLRAFYALSAKNQSEKKCLECDIAGGCTWCSGFNYDVSSIGTLFERQTYICEMHKANVEVNKFLWRQYELSRHCISPHRYKKLTSISPYNKYLYILCDNKFPNFCEYSNNETIPQEKMDDTTLLKTIEFCDKNNFVPIFCGNANLPLDYYAYQIVPYADLISGNCNVSPNCFTIFLISASQIFEDDAFNKITNVNNIIITFKASQLKNLRDMISILSCKYSSLNISILLEEVDIPTNDYIFEYNEFLKFSLEHVKECWTKNNFLFLNTITHELFANGNRPCGAGKNSYTIAPDGKIYLCAGFYNSNPADHIGDIEIGISNPYGQYCDMDNAPLCKDCVVRHCNRCILKNKKGTGEYHIPTELQCVIARMEYQYSRKLSDALNHSELSFPGKYNSKLKSLEGYDPLFESKGADYPNHGYSKLAKSLLET